MEQMAQFDKKWDDLTTDNTDGEGLDIEFPGYDEMEEEAEYKNFIALGGDPKGKYI